MKTSYFIIVAFLLTTHSECFDFKKALFVNLLVIDKNESQKEIVEDYSMQILEKKSEYKYYIQSNSNVKNHECKKADKVKQMIAEYINNESKRVYEDVFISTLEENNKYYDNCYFPRSHEASFFWSFIEDNVVRNAKDNKKAMKLLIDLCYLYRNNAEFSVELFAFAIINATINNPTLFVKELAGRSQSEINLCINKLKYLKNCDDIVKIRKEIAEIKESEYQEVVNKIKVILPD